MISDNDFNDTWISFQEHYCTCCGATLNEQEGFNPDLPVWTCTECGTQLYGEDVYDGELFPEVMWYCDQCEDLLNNQPGFRDDCGNWVCQKCGYENAINSDEIYESEEAYRQARANDPEAVEIIEPPEKIGSFLFMKGDTENLADPDTED